MEKIIYIHKYIKYIYIYYILYIDSVIIQKKRVGDFLIVHFLALKRLIEETGRKYYKIKSKKQKKKNIPNNSRNVMTLNKYLTVVKSSFA